MKYYVIGDDKSLKEIGDEVLKVTGGNMTGNIGYKSATREGDMIRFVSGDANGSGISIGDGGCVVIGSGESARLFTPENGSVESLILSADTTITFMVNAQSGAESAKEVTLDRNGLLSGHQKAITSGTAAPSGGSNGDIYIQY